MKPRITTRSVANSYAAKDERIIEFSFEGGKGGLISFRHVENNAPVIDIYRIDDGIRVNTPDKTLKPEESNDTKEFTTTELRIAELIVDMNYECDHNELKAQLLIDFVKETYPEEFKEMMKTPEG